LSADRRLPRGRHGLDPELIAESQRWRLLVAVGEVLAERGYDRLGSREVASAAGVSSATFYRHFEDIDACLIAAHEMAGDCVYDLAAEGCRGVGEWGQRLQSALGAVFAFLASEPALARLLAADVAAGVPAIAAARERLLGRLAGLLCAGRQARLADAAELPAMTERYLLYGAVGLCAARLLAGEAASLQDLSPELATLLALPYAPSPAQPGSGK
jgi:AcrR family transcriptional regulator